MTCEICAKGWWCLVLVHECGHCADCCECPDDDTAPYTSDEDIVARNIRAQEQHAAEEEARIIGFFYEVEDQDRDEGEVIRREVRFVDGNKVYHVEIPVEGPIEAYVWDREAETMIQSRVWDRK